MTEAHFTCTGFVIHEDKTLFLWHPRLQMWVPPGGHLLPSEDPVTAVLREVQEETGLEVEVIPVAPHLPFSYPRQVQPPYTVLIEDAADPQNPHFHIDLIYFCRPVAGPSPVPRGPFLMCWATESDLRQGYPLEPQGACGLATRPSEDVRLLALEGFRLARERR